MARSMLGWAVALLVATGLPAEAQTPSPAVEVLSAQEVKSQIVGHRVEAQDGGMAWYYERNGKYEGDDGRNARSGTYAVRADGRLCWQDSTGVSGCFQYYRDGGKLRLRRADRDNKTELGVVKVGPL